MVNKYLHNTLKCYFRRETKDIGDGADRILNQLLVSKILQSFEHKISMAVNDYLGIENGTVTTEVNGMS